MSDLREFITARLDEDERRARSATPGPWEETGPDSIAEWCIYGAGWVIAETRQYPREDMQNYWPKLRKPVTVVEHGNENAAHIVRHDPARVLREVEAKRRILAEALALQHEDCGDPYLSCAAASAPDDRCTCAATPTRQRLLSLLALPYAEHPAYREEWRP